MYPHGLISWTDISLPDPEKGKAFYTALFGWRAEDQFDHDGNYIYTMFSIDGKSAAGMGPMPPEMQDAGFPPMWQTYVAVDDVDEAVAKVLEHGGNVIMGAMQVLDSGRMAIVAEPGGAVVSFWETGNHVGAEVFNQPGALTWAEVNTRDSEATREFWSEVLGWTFSPIEGLEGVDYHVIHNDNDHEATAGDGTTGGVLQMDDNWPAEIPPHWMVYFWVADTDATIDKLLELGGSVSVPAFDSNAGRMAVVADDQGGTFSIIAPPVAD